MPTKITGKASVSRPPQHSSARSQPPRLLHTMKTICESCCDSPATLVACGREGTVLCGTCDTPRYAPTSVTLLSRGPRGRRWITRVDRGRRSSNLRSEGRDTRERVADRTYPTLLPPRDVFSPDTRSVQGERVAFVAGPETATQAPLPCDICQSAPAVALCHEDRAFLCRACDASIHSANEHVAAHSRFLFTNVKLELEPVGASKKRKAAEMRSSDSTDLATPALGKETRASADATTFVLGDATGITALERELLMRQDGISTVALGPRVLLASHCIVLAHAALDNV